jgi:hypothetical protein
VVEGSSFIQENSDKLWSLERAKDPCSIARPGEAQDPPAGPRAATSRRRIKPNGAIFLQSIWKRFLLAE